MAFEIHEDGNDLQKAKKDSSPEITAIEERQAYVATRILKLEAIDGVLTEEIEHLIERRKIARLGINDARKEMQLLGMGQMVMNLD